MFFLNKILISSVLILILAIVFHGEIFKKTYPVNTQGAVLITGASTGIGRDTAILFAKNGFKTFANVRKQSDADSIQKEHKNIIPIVLEITSETDRKNARKVIEDYVKKEKINFVGLVNNAAISQRLPMEFAPLDIMRHVFDVNFFGVVALTQEFLPLLRRSHGRVINIGSLLGEIALPFSGTYSGSKFALKVFSDALRRELRPWNIYVGLIEPSYVKTAMANRSLSVTSSTFKSLPKEAHDYYGEDFTEEKLVKRWEENEKKILTGHQLKLDNLYLIASLILDLILAISLDMDHQL